MKDKMYEHSKFVITRLDAQYDKMNIKMSIFLATNTAVVILLGGSIIKDYIDFSNNFSKISYIISIISAIISVVLLLIAAMPYLPFKKKKKLGSVLILLFLILQYRH